MRPHNTKLTPQAVREIHALVRYGFTKTSVAAAYGISDSLACKVALGRLSSEVAELPTPLPAIAYVAGSPLRLTKRSSSLTPQQVVEIRRLAAAHYSQRSIATAYRSPQSVISGIVNGTLYAAVPDVPGPLPTIPKRSPLKLRQHGGPGSRNRSVSRSGCGAVANPWTGRSLPMKYRCGSRSSQRPRLDRVTVRQNKVAPG